jgi:hypothetical protein
MNTITKSVLKGIAGAGALALCLAASPVYAQPRVEVRISPPAWFIATTRPVYHGGHAAYWYRDRWVYREGREWRHYREEPRELRSRRDWRRQHYERGEGVRHR